jgi:hypothetical protein
MNRGWVRAWGALFLGAVAIACSSEPPFIVDNGASAPERGAAVVASTSEAEQEAKDESAASAPLPLPTPGAGVADAGSGPSSEACTESGASRPCNGKDAAGTACTGISRCMRANETSPLVWAACECAVMEVYVDIQGDCVTAKCPANAPHAVGCKLDFMGNDERGCVATTASPAELFLKEGNDCGAGRVVGKIFCSSKPGTGIDALTCPINKKQPVYVTSPAKCPS